MLHLLLPIRRFRRLITFAEDQEEVQDSLEIFEQMVVEPIALYTRTLVRVAVEQMMTSRMSGVSRKKNEEYEPECLPEENYLPIFIHSLSLSLSLSVSRSLVRSGLSFLATKCEKLTAVS